MKKSKFKEKKQKQNNSPEVTEQIRVEAELHPYPRPISPKAYQAFSLKEMLCGSRLGLSFLI